MRSQAGVPVVTADAVILSAAEVASAWLFATRGDDGEVKHGGRVASLGEDEFILPARWGTYGTASPSRRAVGRLGELAVDWWFVVERQAASAFLYELRGFLGCADIVVNPVASPWKHPRLSKRAAANEGAAQGIVQRYRDLLDEQRRFVDDERVGRYRRLRSAGVRGSSAFVDLAVEVKTWSAGTWERFGRRINADQLPRIIDKAEVIVWCHTETTAELTPDWLTAPTEAVKVRLAGWSSVKDLIEHGSPVWTSPYRSQIEMPSDRIRPMATLTPAAQLELPTWPREPSRRLRFPGSCGHRVFGALCWTCAWEASYGPVPVASGSDSGLPRSSTSLELGWVTFSAGAARFVHAATRQMVEQVHGGWPFTAPTESTHVTSVHLDRPMCPGCFPL